MEHKSIRELEHYRIRADIQAKCGLWMLCGANKPMMFLLAPHGAQAVTAFRYYSTTLLLYFIFSKYSPKTYDSSQTVIRQLSDCYQTVIRQLSDSY